MAGIMGMVPTIDYNFSQQNQPSDINKEKNLIHDEAVFLTNPIWFENR